MKTMILKEHPIKYTATEVRRAITRLETYESLNPQEAAIKGVKQIVDKLREVYMVIPKEYWGK
jgi:DNA-directed RNA polymerase subunit L